MRYTLGHFLPLCVVARVVDPRFNSDPEPTFDKKPDPTGEEKPDTDQTLYIFRYSDRIPHFSQKRIRIRSFLKYGSVFDQTP